MSRLLITLDSFALKFIRKYAKIILPYTIYINVSLGACDVLNIDATSLLFLFGIY